MASLQNSFTIFSWFSTGTFLWCEDCPVCEEGTVDFPPLPSPIFWYQLIYRPCVTRATFWPKGQSSANWFSNAQILWPQPCQPHTPINHIPKSHFNWYLQKTVAFNWLLLHLYLGFRSPMDVWACLFLVGCYHTVRNIKKLILNWPTSLTTERQNDREVNATQILKPGDLSWNASYLLVLTNLSVPPFPPM